MKKNQGTSTQTAADSSTTDAKLTAATLAQNPMLCEGLVDYYVRWRHIPMDLMFTPMYLISIDHTKVKDKPNASNYDLMKAISKEFINMNISPDDVSIESFEQLPFA